MDFENIPDELKERAKACQSPEEILELAKAEGYELSEEELDAVSGGFMNWGGCPNNSCAQLCTVGAAREASSTTSVGKKRKLGLM